MDADEHMMRTASLGADVSAHGKEINEMRKRIHDLANLVSAMTGTLTRIERTHDDIIRRFERHMDNEEASFKAMYERLTEMDKDLKAEFHERDEKIHALDNKSVKIISVATGAFIVAQIVLNVVMKVGLGV